MARGGNNKFSFIRPEDDLIAMQEIPQQDELIAQRKEMLQSVIQDGVMMVPLDQVNQAIDDILEMRDWNGNMDSHVHSASAPATMNDMTSSETVLVPSDDPDYNLKTLQRIKDQSIVYQDPRMPKGDTCLIGKGVKDRNDYWYMWFNGRKEAAHRVSFVLMNNDTLSRGEVVMHACDNRGCTVHGSKGTPSENMQDMFQKGRSGKAKVTESEVLEMHAKYHESGWSYAEIAVEYKLSKSAVAQIMRGQRWPRVKAQYDAQRKANK